MFSAGQIVAHAVGDYVIQSDWMAVEKTKRVWPAFAHALSYALPFLLITTSPRALAVIVLSHVIIDRWRLARYVVWAKNFVGSPWSSAAAEGFARWVVGRTSTMPPEVWTAYRRPWSECTKTGYPDARDAWLTTWLVIIADNAMHLVCNGLAIHYL